jgi:two-component system cell cycle response regulator DivK
MTKRVLVVEDHEDNRQILRDLLESAGYDMIEAKDGEEALVAAGSQCYRCHVIRVERR